MENANAILNYLMLPKIIKLFRFTELFVFLFMISKFSSQLPFVLNFSADYFRGITFTIIRSPTFVFVIGNLIVLILVLKSRADISCDGDGNADLGYVCVKSCDVSVRNVIVANVIVARTTTTTTPANVIVANVIVARTTTTTPANVIVASKKRKICRRKSENLIMKTKCRDDEITHRELRRSVTEISRSRNCCDGGGGDSAAVEVEEKLSGDEFRRTVEAFIARQQKTFER